MDKKAQGISLNFIVIAIIAALVLIIIIAFTVGGLGASLSKIFQAGEQSTENADLDVAKANCEKYCNDAKQINSPEDWGAESYCKKSYNFDSGAVHCWEAPIGVECSASGSDIYDTPWTCDHLICKAGCDEISCADKSITDTETCTELGYSECIAQDETICKWEQ